MYIQQYYRFGELTSSQLDAQGESLTEDEKGWLQSELAQTPLVSYEEDGDYSWDPHEISLHEATLVRYSITHMDRNLDLAVETLRTALAKGLIALSHQMTSEPPVRWHLHYHAHPLPYEGIVGCLGHPKRFYFRAYAKSPSEAWKKVTSSLGDHSIKKKTLSLHRMGVDGIPFSLFKARHSEPSRELPVAGNILEAQKKLKDHTVTRTMGGAMAQERLEGKKGFEWAFIAGKIMAECGLAIPSETGELIHYGLVLHALLSGHDVNNLPGLLEGDVLYMSEGNQLVGPEEGMFDFTKSEQDILLKSPSVRFLVINNIPVNAPLSLRQQQAWCDHYHRECA